jgi:amino acid adenylation domain-containing protein
MLPARLPEPEPHQADDSRLTIAHLFVRQAAAAPDAAALICAGRHLYYRELDEQSNQIANKLQASGVQTEALVGIFLPRTELLVVSMLGILKAGGAYVPLDPSYPQERLSQVIVDSGMRILVTSREARTSLPSIIPNLTVVTVDDSAIATRGPSTFEPKATSNNLAYVIYTSGSTGAPKGVMVEHRNVVNFFDGLDRAIGSNPGVWLAVTSIAFDISVLELLWTLTRGFTVVLHGDDSATFADEIIRHGVTHLQMTPSLTRLLTLDARAFAALGTLHQILLGGEVVPASLIIRLREVFRGEIYNMYGPTETTVWSTYYRIDGETNSVPIGSPVLNTEIFLLDEELMPVAPGEPGEIYIGGDGVARGYWNRTGLTDTRFITLPALTKHRVYRTGDRARLLPDGNLEFVGRVDQQVKLRGHRIELREIEALLEQLQGVREAAVVLREEKEGDPRLIAYMTTGSAVPPAAAALKAALARSLPTVMIPSSFYFLAALPLTQNGKIDRNALLRLPVPVNSIEPDRMDHRPQTDVERVVAAAWADALGVSAVSLHDNFFDLGAHSLTVAEVQAALQSQFGRDIPLVDLFQYSTVHSLAHHLAGTTSANAENAGADRAQRRRLAMKRGS